MSKFDEVNAKLRSVQYMGSKEAKVIRSLMTEIEARNVLELGFFRGKGSCYIAAILEDMGSTDGHLTTIDRTKAKTLEGNIHDNLTTLGLTHRVTPIFAHRSYTWEMAQLLKRNPRPVFDLCYIDGGHTWDTTGFGFVLADMMLKPGGVIILDDLNWTLGGHISTRPKKRAAVTKEYDAAEIAEQGVRLVWNTIVPHLNYKREELTELDWGIARKQG